MTSTMDEAAHAGPPARNVVILYEEAEAHLAALRARFPGTAFHACTCPSGPARRPRPEVVWAAPSEAAPFPRDALLPCASLRWLSIGLAGVGGVVPWDDDRLVVTAAAAATWRPVAARPGADPV